MLNTRRTETLASAQGVATAPEGGLLANILQANPPYSALWDSRAILQGGEVTTILGLSGVRW